jgi:CBS domain-containing membrane protein
MNDISHNPHLVTLIGTAITFTLLGVLHALLLENVNLVLLIGSLGATSTIIFSLWGQRVASLKSVAVGHLTSSIIGVLSQLFLLPHSTLAAVVLSVTLAIVMMQVLGCVHPPGGAVALIAVTGDPSILTMGFYFIPISVIGALLVYGIGYVLFEVLSMKPYQIE